MTIINQKSISGITSITFASAGDDLLTFHSNNGTERFRIDNSGNTKITAGIVTTLTVTGNGTVGGTLGVTGETTFTTHINFGDNAKAIFGNGSDLQIYHNGTHSYIKEEGTGELRLGSNNAVRITKHDSETLATFTADGAVELYYDNDLHFATTSLGCKTNGDLSFRGDGDVEQILFDASDASLKFTDNKSAKFGDGDDLKIYHDGTVNRVRFDVNTVFEKNDSTDIATFLPDGAVTLFHNGSQKLTTKSDGVVVTGSIYLDGSGGTNSANALDDYEEGTFTPAAGSPAISGTSPTYSGFYTKIGNIVSARIVVASSSNDLNVTSYAVITGLPFTSAASGGLGTGTVVTEDIDIFDRQGFINGDNNGTTVFVSNCGSTSGTNTLNMTLVYTAA